ncbi:ribosomal-processing cysteine protease Prp [Cohnella sp. CFH 77786]|uniref:ribosomal-processing cysteine protease Prp n=1 Tax=Cohnella sp. CFH 77786 TaxID=2662265 RepID=UPI001C6093F9|nr:ribosomal-processing cysteine protease Prp [Cohnella sp. CFH 77786]MBW5447871.1 ribosomal-processing cysteine protease Prp [Cohnella sp. CFH 77786]
MITVTIERGEDGRIRRFSVSGHAGYDVPGQDIVCAGVSAVTVGAVNAIEQLTGLVPKAKMRGGWLTAEAPQGGDPELESRAQLLLEGMLVSLQTIADEYGKYVQIQETIKHRRR